MSRLPLRKKDGPRKLVKCDNPGMAAVMAAPLDEKCEYFSVWMGHHAKLLMSVIEDTTKRVEIVTMLPHLIRNLDKYRGILGVHLTRLLEKHGEIIYHFLGLKAAVMHKRDTLEEGSDLETAVQQQQQQQQQQGASASARPSRRPSEELRSFPKPLSPEGEEVASLGSAVSEPDLDTLLVRQNKAAAMLSHSCKNILRNLHHQPHKVDAILHECEFRTESGKVLVKSLRAVGNMLLKKFLTSREMIEKEKDEESKIKKAIIDNNRVIADLNRQVEIVMIEKENDFVDGERHSHENYPPDFNKHDWFQVAVAALVQSRRFASIYHIRRKREIIERLAKILSQIENASAEHIWRIEAESRRQKASILRHSEALKQKLRQQIVQLKQQFDTIFKKNVKHERSMRKTAYKVRARVEAIMAKLDEKMFVLQEELDQVEELYKKQKLILEELEERFEPLDAEYTEVLEERARQRARDKQERDIEGRRDAAASTLQAFWRSYLVRKAIASKSKKKKKRKK